MVILPLGENRLREKLPKKGAADYERTAQKQVNAKWQPAPTSAPRAVARRIQRFNPRSWSHWARRSRYHHRARHLLWYPRHQRRARRNAAGVEVSSAQNLCSSEYVRECTLHISIHALCVCTVHDHQRLCFSKCPPCSNGYCNVLSESQEICRTWNPRGHQACCGQWCQSNRPPLPRWR